MIFTINLLTSGKFKSFQEGLSRVSAKYDEKYEYQLVRQSFTNILSGGAVMDVKCEASLLNARRSQPSNTTLRS